MALAVAIHFTITDAKGKSSTTDIHVPTGFSLLQYAEFAQTMGQVVADLSEGILTKVSISLPLSLSGATIRSTASNLADIAKKCLFTASGAVSSLLARFNLPTYDESHSVNNTDQLDLADADVAAYIAIIESGGGGAHPCDKRENDLTSVHVAREIFRQFN